MIFGLGTGRVTNSQKVADNKKPTDPKKCFTVAWEKHEAHIADVVGIKATAHITISNPGQLTVAIWEGGKYYTGAQNVQLKQNGQITAAWKVAPRKVGDFEKVYHVVVSYGGGLTGETSRGLKVTRPGKSGDGFDF